MIKTTPTLIAVACAAAVAGCSAQLDEARSAAQAGSAFDRALQAGYIQLARAELDEKFHWLKGGHRNYLLHRLSNVGWLEYFRDQSMYMISDKAEALMRILNRFTMGPELVENEGVALAEIEFSQMLEHEDVSEQLHFLSNRLRKHIIRADHALESKSGSRCHS